MDFYDWLILGLWLRAVIVLVTLLYLMWKGIL